MDGFVPDQQPEDHGFVPDQPDHAVGFVPDDHASGFIPDVAPSPSMAASDMRAPESKDAEQKSTDGLSVLRQMAPRANTVFKDSAFAPLQNLIKDVNDAGRGIHMDVGHDPKNPFSVPINGPSMSRYVDKDGNPVENELAESGQVEGLRTEPVLDYFVPGLKGKAAPYFESHEVNQAVAKSFDSGDPSILQSMKSELVGVAQNFKDPQKNGFYKYLLTPMTEGEQMLARGTTALLSKLGSLGLPGGIPPEDAKKMLSQEELHYHDINDYYSVDKSEGATARIQSATRGFAMDLIDPLMWVGTAGKVVKYGSEAIEYGGRMITDFGQMSRMEASHFKLAHDIERIITSDAKMMPAEAGLAGDADHAVGMLDLSRGPQMPENIEAVRNFGASSPGSGMNFNELNDSLKLSPEAKEAVMKARDLRLDSQSVLTQIANGDKQMALKVPFTNTALEIPFISDALEYGGENAAKAMIEMKNGMGRTLDSVNRFVAAQGTIGAGITNGIGSAINGASWVANKMGSFATETSRPIFNAASRIFSNDQALAKYQANAFKDNWYKMFMGADGKVDGAPLKQVFDLLDIEPQRADSHYLEMNHGTDTASEGYQRSVEKLSGAREQAAKMRANMSADQLKLAEEIQKQNIAMGDAMKSRNLPFYEINPLDPETTATGYVKHMMTKEYLSQFRNTDEAMKAAQEFTEATHPGVDKSLLARNLKIPVAQANASYAAAHDGMKMFIEDPIAAHTARMRTLQDSIRKHDIMHTLDDLMIYRKPGEEALPKGYVKFDPEIMGQSPMVFKDAGENPLKWTDQFMPEKAKNWLADGNEIHLPEDVNTRLQYMLNPHANTGPVSGLLNNGVFKGMQYLFRNNALFGTGYLGMRMMSHLATTIYSGSNVAKLFDALHLMTPEIGQTERLFKIGDEIIPKSKLFEQAVEDGMIHNGMMKEDDWGHVIENIATTSKERAGLASKALTVFDHAMLYSTNRAISAGIDDAGKLAHYMTRLEQGYTRAGAAESAEFWFYNYTQRNPVQSLTSAIIPFSSVGIKTMEQTLTALKEMNVAHLTLPEKVNSVLAGNYISSPEERRAIAEILPKWQQHNVYGPLLPGGRELMIEIPWVYHTMNAFMSPFIADENTSLPVNPLLKLPGIVWSAYAANNGSEMGDDDQVKSAVTEMAKPFIPPPLAHSLTMYQILHPEENHILDLASWYVPKGALRPTAKDDSPTMEKYRNAKTFGEWMEHQYGDNAAMNMWLYGNPDGRKGPAQSSTDTLYSDLDERREGAISAGIGNYIRAQMRNITFGISRATALDTDFLGRNAALDKQSKALVGQFKELKSREGFSLVAPGSMFDKKVQEKIMNDGTPAEKEIIARSMAIEDKQVALHEFYGNVLMDEHKQTGIFRQIFGIEPNKVQYSMHPHSTEALNIRENYRNILQEQNAGE